MLPGSIDKHTLEVPMKAIKIDESAMEVRKGEPGYKIPGYTGRGHIDKALEAFLNKRVDRARFGNYFVDGPELCFRTCSLNYLGEANLKEEVLAVRLKSGQVIANSSSLSLPPKKDNVTEIQQRLSLIVPMVPFSVFEQAGKDLNEIEILDRGPEQSVTRSVFWKMDKKTNKRLFKDETVHFTGASLYRIGEDCYLFDLDRRELEHKIFNPFLVKLPVDCNSIDEAYACLKPKEVLEAESKGLEVLRQGEWFFIPVTDTNLLSRVESFTKKDCIEIILRAGSNRPNEALGVHFDDTKAYTSKEVNRDTGNFDRDWEFRRQITKLPAILNFKVDHRGREHATLLLRGWYFAVPNTATESFTISGDID
jgi:hypothetical protein